VLNPENQERTCSPIQLENQKLMKLAIFFAVASLALIGNGLADQYDTLAAQGYRWVNVNGPYACTSEQHVEGLVAHRTDARELEVVQNIQCYYLIPGTIVQVIKEDPAHGMTEMRVAGRPRYLWTYTRFLSKRPVQDTYGVIQTAQNSGLNRATDTALAPSLPSDDTTARTRPNGNP
jgi:hypothetical protein